MGKTGSNMIFMVKHLNVKKEAQIILGIRILIMVHWLMT